MPARNTPSPFRNAICDCCYTVTVHKDGNCVKCIERGIKYINQMPIVNITREDAENEIYTSGTIIFMDEECA